MDFINLTNYRTTSMVEFGCGIFNKLKKVAFGICTFSMD